MGRKIRICAAVLLGICLAGCGGAAGVSSSAGYDGGVVTLMSASDIADVIYGSEFPCIIYASEERLIYSAGSIAVIYDFASGEAAALQTSTLGGEDGEIPFVGYASRDGSAVFPSQRDGDGKTSFFRCELPDRNVYRLTQNEADAAQKERFLPDEESISTEDIVSALGVEAFHMIKKDGVCYAVGGAPREESFRMASGVIYVLPENGAPIKYQVFQ